MDTINDFKDKVINAYGGKEVWAKAKEIKAEVSASGLAFSLKSRPAFKHAQTRLSIHQPIGRIKPIGNNPMLSGVLKNNEVCIENSAGKIISQRKDPRKYFPYGKRLFKWDDLDMAYFANYAFWNYFTLPALLFNPNITWELKNDFQLIATFPDDIPTHSKKQSFLFDKNSYLLLQHNYTAEVISGLAKAANVVVSHGKSNGVLYGNKRKVSPSFIGGKALGFPILIDIDVHKYELI